jgi:hypothetical protein
MDRQDRDSGKGHQERGGEEQKSPVKLHQGDEVTKVSIFEH